MAQAILTKDGMVVTRRSVSKLSISEGNSESERIIRARFDEASYKIHGDSFTIRDNSSHTPQYECKDLNLNEEDETLVYHTKDPVDTDGYTIFNQSFYNILINSEINLPKDGKITNGKVIGRTIGDDGSIHGEYHEYPSKNKIMYDVEFDDGTIKQYSANIIAMNIIYQLSNNNHESMPVKHIIDMERDYSALKNNHQIVNTPIGKKRNLQTTTEWKFLVKFNDGSKAWVPEQSIKSSNPIQTAEFVKSR